MVTVKCEKTGLDFESATGRQRNHPEIMAILQEANHSGWSRYAYQALEKGKEKGYTTFEEFIFEMRQAEGRAREEQHTKFVEDRKRQQDEREARPQRQVTNDLLRRRGYRWQKYENDEEDIDFFGAPAFEWILRSPDDRVVSVSEAMLELAWQSVTFAKEWLAERSIEETMPAIEKLRQAEREAAEEAKRQTEIFSAEQQEYRQEAEQALLEAGFTEEAAHNQAIAWSKPHSPQEDAVAIASPMWLGIHEAVPAINSDFRYGILITGEWCGIGKILERDDLPEQFRGQLQQYAERNRR